MKLHSMVSMATRSGLQSFFDWDQQELWGDLVSDWSGLTPVWPGGVPGSRLNPTQAHGAPRGKFQLGEFPARGVHLRDTGIWAGSDPMYGCQTRVSLAHGFGRAEGPRWKWTERDDELSRGLWDNNIKIETGEKEEEKGSKSFTYLETVLFLSLVAYRPASLGPSCLDTKLPHGPLKQVVT